MKASLTLVAAIAASCVSSLGAQQVVEAVGEFVVVDPADRANRAPVALSSVSSPMVEGLPAGIAAAEEQVEPWSCSLKVGARNVAVVIAKSTADQDLPDRLWVDEDGDGKFGEAELRPITVTSRKQRDTDVQSGSVQGLEITNGEALLQANLSFMRASMREPRVTLSFPTYLRATVEVGGQSRIVAVVDGDFDGAFDGPKDLWTIVAPDAQPVSSFMMNTLGEQKFDAGNLLGLEVDHSAIKLAQAPASGPRAQDLASHRERVEHIWAERFDAERDGFVAQRGLDTSRKLTQKPIEWRYVTFAEGLELAKESGKPLFVDVMAFWCVWCYRLDYYTYPDQEVAAMLNEQFIPIKIVQEQDTAGDYELVRKKLEAQGIPAMGVFTADGNCVHKIGGWKKPEDFLTELKTGHAAAVGSAKPAK